MNVIFKITFYITYYQLVKYIILLKIDRQVPDK